MKWVRRYNSLAIGAVATSVLSFCMADGAFGLAALSVVVMSAAFVFRNRRPPPTLPKTAVNVLVLLAIINAALRGMSAQPGSAVISHLGEFLVFVQLIKLFDRRSHRDETQLLTLSVFIAIAAILTSNSFVVGVLLLVYSPLIIACSMLAQIRQGADGPAGSVGRPEQRDGQGNPRRGDRQFASVAAASTVGITVLAIAVFVLTPRGVGSGRMGNWGQIRQATIGFTDTVKLGQSGLLSESSTPVLDLLVTDQSGVNLGAPGRMFYLRGAVQSRYNTGGRIWQADQGAGDEVVMDQPGTPVRLTDQRVPPGSTLHQKVTIRNLSRAGGHLFSAWRPVSISFDGGLTIEHRAGSNVLKYRDVTQPRFSYTVVSDPSHASFMDAPPDDLPRSVPDSVRLQAAEVLASRGIEPRIDGETSTERARRLAAAFRDYLRDNFDYTTDLPAPPGRRDPIEWFLTESRRGHCEYFASALATMLQSQDVPARLVTGYVAGEFNTLTGEYLVRESNAHAWVEVYLGDGRWAPYDATPVSVVERLHQPTWSLTSQLRQWYDMLEFNWSSSVVGFDGLKQRSLLDGLAESTGIKLDVLAWLNGVGEWLIRTLRLDRERIRIPPMVLSVSSLAVIVGLAIFLAWSVWHRRAGRSRVRRAPLPPDLRFLSDAERALNRAGVGRPDHRTPLEHVRVVSSFDVEASTAFGELVRLFYRARFGETSLSPSDRAAAAQTLARLRARLRETNRR